MNKEIQQPPCVLSTNRVPDEHLEPLLGFCTVIQGEGPYDLMPREEVLTQAHKVDAIINQAELRVDRELLDAAPQLKIVANVAAGTDNLDLDEMARRGVWATNVPDAFTNAVADHTLALLLALARGLFEADAYVRSGQWERDGFQPSRWDGMELAGKTWGVIGFGQSGRAVKQRAEAFGMKVIFSSSAPSHEPGYRTLDELLAASDVVSLHVPLTSATHRLIDASKIRMMKPGAVLLNLSRGKTVDQSAMIEALRAGDLSGAGLDVFQDEPAVPEALRSLPNVVLTPHIGGGTTESRRSARRRCAANVARVLQGAQPLTPVNSPVPGMMDTKSQPSSLSDAEAARQSKQP